MKETTLSMFAFFAVLVCCNKCADGLRILAIFPLNGKSHFVMCERLAKGLAEKGHQVDVYGHFPLKNPIPNYTDYSLKGPLPDFVNNITYDSFQLFRQTNMMKFMMGTFANDFCGLLDHYKIQELFKRLKREQPYDIVITEAFVMNCHLAWGRFLNIPMVSIMTGEFIDWYNEPLGNPINLAVVPGRSTNLLHPMDFWGRMKNVLLYYFLCFSHDYYSSSQNKFIEKHFGRDYPHAKDLIRDIDLVLVNSHFSLEGVRPYIPGIVPVAGLHIVDDDSKLPSEVQKWLDDSKNGCIYVSFGSMVRIETFPKTVLDAFYSTSKNIAPVRVLLKIAKPQDLPSGLPSNVMTQSWFSQIQVLKHKNIKAFVTHGGLMSIQEAIYAGVPLIGIPLFGDQFLNIAVQVKKKIALTLSLEEITETLLTSAIKEILDNSIYKKNMRELSEKFFDRPMKPIDTATYWVEYLARHGKGALKAPVVDMPWWQVNLLDVYGLILLILISVVYVLKSIVAKVLSCFRPVSNDIQQKKVKKNQ